jgi:tetraacyldisaccharide 4'-kinase
MGGAGKTPAAIAIAQQLITDGKKPVFLSRGYGGTVRGPLQMDPRAHTADEVGDEPLLLARTAPVIISRDRVAGAKAAIAAGADVILMDDGFQNPTLYKDRHILVMDGTLRCGNGRLFPAGPLRESLSNALKRTDMVLWVGNPDAHDPMVASIQNAQIPLIPARITVDTLPSTHQPYLAFAGIGYPEKFFRTLEQSNVHLVDTVSFPDHYRYTASDITRLRQKAAALNATLITTEKDYVRLALPLREGIATLPIRMVWDGTLDIFNV